MTCGWPPSTAAMTELVVPRSMPTAFAMVVLLVVSGDGRIFGGESHPEVAWVPLVISTTRARDAEGVDPAQGCWIRGNNPSGGIRDDAHAKRTVRPRRARNLASDVRERPRKRRLAQSR